MRAGLYRECIVKGCDRKGEYYGADGATCKRHIGRSRSDSIECEHPGKRIGGYCPNPRCTYTCPGRDLIMPGKSTRDGDGIMKIIYTREAVFMYENGCTSRIYFWKRSTP